MTTRENFALSRHQGNASLLREVLISQEKLAPNRPTWHIVGTMPGHFETRLAELLQGHAPRPRWHFAAPSAHPDYNCWKKMRNRCNNPNNGDYRYYGARGIRVCARWNCFADFIADMGPRPTGRHTIDRINNDGNYEPGNCRWATMAQQNANRRFR